MQKIPFNNLYQLIENNNNISPNKNIIFEHELTISNQELKTYIDRIASFLSKVGIKPGDKVALIMSNCWQFVVNLFAISKVGATVVPINNFLKEDELAYILNDSQAKLLFASNKFANEVKNLLVKTNIYKIVWVDGCPVENEKNLDHTKILANNYAITEAYPAALEDTALIVYTSGTTGKPKGAMLAFRNILSNCQSCMDFMRTNRNKFDMLCYLPMFHSFTLTATVLVPIYSNSRMIIIRSISGIKDFKYLLKQLLLKRCQYFTGVPDIYAAMSRAKLPWYFHWFHSVKGFISGGAPLSDEIYKKFTQAFKRGKLLQGYGISECSPVVSCNTVTANRPGSVGRPIGDYQVKIFDENMHELPIGSIGEICVKGDCVMQGYYNRPDETAKAIINGWFKTGDIGRVDEENYIFILDRIKDLIIHKGMNIYPREIEEALYTHEKINACAVIGGKDKDGSEIPIIYVEMKEDQLLTESEVKDFLRPHLATFKLPRKVFFIDKLPRNATGKILKRELRDLNKDLL